MKKICKYYDDNECFSDMDMCQVPCTCEGDRCKCDFYSDIRDSAMLERTAELMNDISDILDRMDKTISDMKSTLENSKEVTDNG